MAIQQITQPGFGKIVFVAQLLSLGLHRHHMPRFRHNDKVGIMVQEAVDAPGVFVVIFIAVTVPPQDVIHTADFFNEALLERIHLPFPSVQHLLPFALITRHNGIFLIGKGKIYKYFLSRQQIGKPFPKEAEYQAKIARLAVLNAELDTEGRKNEQGGITQGNTPPVQGQGQGKKPKL